MKTVLTNKYLISSKHQFANNGYFPACSFFMEYTSNGNRKT